MNNPDNNKIYPFKFLDSYTKDDKDIFFGRDEETSQLYEILQQSGLVLVYGASGTGKTSLIQCGLAQKYNDYDWMPFFIRRGTNLNKSIFNSLQKYIPDTEDSVSNFMDELYDEKPKEKIKRNPVIDAVRNIYMAQFKPVYLIFDQFEELFILGTKAEQNEFIKTVKELLQVDEPIKLIFSIREEYLGHLYDFEKEVPQLLRKKIRVEAMNYSKVEQIINGINTFKNSVVEIQEGQEEMLTTGIFEMLKTEKELGVELPYLQVLLDKLYLNITGDETHQNQAVFTVGALNQLGNIENILSDFLEGQVNSISQQLLPKFKQATMETLWKILSPFATLEGTKEPISVKHLYALLPQSNEQLINKVVTELTNRRILRYNESTELYELVHDSLAKQVAEKRSEDDIALIQVEQLIKSQLAQKEIRGLFTVKQLAFIEPFREQLKLTKEEQALIDQSYQAIEKESLQERKKQRNKLMLVSSVAAIALIAAAVAVIMYFNALEAESTAKQKENEAIESLELLKKEQAEKEAINFKNLENRAQVIINAGGCPTEIIHDMKNISATHPDSTRMNRKINEIETKPECK